MNNISEIAQLGAAVLRQKAEAITDVSSLQYFGQFTRR